MLFLDLWPQCPVCGKYMSKGGLWDRTTSCIFCGYKEGAMDDIYEMIGVLTHSELNAEVRKLESLKKRLLKTNTRSDSSSIGAWYMKGLLDMLDFITVHRSRLPSIILEHLVVEAELGDARPYKKQGDAASEAKLEKLHSNITLHCREVDEWPE